MHFIEQDLAAEERAAWVEVGIADLEHYLWKWAKFAEFQGLREVKKDPPFPRGLGRD